MKGPRKAWQSLYSKVRADIVGSLATGGVGAAALYLLDAAGVSTTAEQKTAIITIGGWLGGKVAAYLRPETHPAGPLQPATPTPAPGAGAYQEELA